MMERKGAEKDLRESEERIRALFESVQVGVVVTGLNAEVLMANPAALRLLGATEEDLMGTTSYDPKSSTFFGDGSPCPPSAHPILRAISKRQPVVNVVFGAERTGIDVVLDLSGRLGRMQLDVEVTPSRVVQESLASIQRDSGSKHAKIRINLNSDLTLEVSDPGRESYEDLSKSKPVPRLKRVSAF